MPHLQWFTQTDNLLPYYGTVYYQPAVVDRPEYYFYKLHKGIKWQHDQAKLLGKIMYIKRKLAWYGYEHYRYRYSNIEKIAQPWEETFFSLKQLVTNLTGEAFNSCLLNLYHNGNEVM